MGRLGNASLSAGSTSGRSAVSLAIAILLACVVAFLDPAVAPAAGPPQIKASWVTEVTATSATLRAEINPNGLSTTYRFEYITEAAYQANLEATPPREGFFGASQVPPPPSAGSGMGSGTTFQKVAQHVSSLVKSTAYSYRPVATNSDPAGPVFGPTHTLTTESFGAQFVLPDNRAWEMVSPVDKGGGAIALPEALFGGGDFQAAASSAELTYSSATAFEGAQSAPPVSQYVSRRTPSGWSTENVSAPLDSAAYGDKPDGAPYRVFSAGLSQGLLFGGLPCRGDLAGCPAPNPVLPGTGAPPGYMAFYARNNETGGFASLLSASDLSHTAVAKEDFEVAFAGASPDLSHIVLSSCAKLTTDAKEVLAPGGCVGQNLYEWSEGTLKAINLLPPSGTET
ncbi:MAG: hypothetical protein WAM82_12855, partial [Thermoanaerobaculia bacterium]